VVCQRQVINIILEYGSSRAGRFTVARPALRSHERSGELLHSVAVT
jgi:hypothetical protein